MKKMMMTMTMMTRATKRKNLPNLRHSAVHPARPVRHHTLRNIVALVCLACAALIVCRAAAVEISVSATAAQKPPSPDDCVFRVTVFTEKGVRLPDAVFTAHPVNKKKPHWDGYSDVRGDFAFRVSFQGDYEIEVKAKGYETQTKKVTSEGGEKMDLVFKLVPRAPKKP
jgi:hypothetical protein